MKPKKTSKALALELREQTAANQRLASQLAQAKFHEADMERWLAEVNARNVTLRAERDLAVNTLRSVAAPRCCCGNEARYLNEHGALCCSLCPLKQGIKSTRLSDIVKDAADGFHPMMWMHPMYPMMMLMAKNR